MPQNNHFDLRRGLFWPRPPWGAAVSRTPAGRAEAGYNGSALAGERGVILIEWYDRSTSRYRLAVGCVGENGIEPNVAYTVDGATGEFVRAS